MLSTLVLAIQEAFGRHEQRWQAYLVAAIAGVLFGLNAYYLVRNNPNKPTTRAQFISKNPFPVMKWIAATIVLLSFLYGLAIGWFEKRDIVFSPWGGFIAGLITFWLFRAALYRFHKKYDDTGVGTTLYAVCSAVAAYYVVLALFAALVGNWRLLIFVVLLAGLSWVIGLAIYRSYAGTLPGPNETGQWPRHKDGKT